MPPKVSQLGLLVACYSVKQQQMHAKAGIVHRGLTLRLHKQIHRAGRSALMAGQPGSSPKP